MMRILMAGASGMVGKPLAERLQEQGHEIVRLVRRKPRNDSEIRWDPGAGDLDVEALRGFDAVVCLSGANISAGRWTEARKRTLVSSRVDSVSLLANRLAELNDGRPRIFVSASAIGYYGANNGDRALDETAPAGEDFLGSLCKQWEAAADPARAAGVRVVHLRLAVVLDPSDGMLKKVLPVFRMNLGGPLGSGKQYFSWVSLEDAVHAFIWGIETEEAVGAYNVAAPYPVTNREFTSALGKAVGRVALLPAPGFAIRLALGEMGESLLLGSARVYPKRLETAGFAFTHPKLDATLRAIL
jgi:uncharacterized protein